MLYRLAQHLCRLFAEALLVCVLLFLSSGLLSYTFPHCCGYRMEFPFLCLGSLFSIFSSISFLCRFTHKKNDAALSPVASRCLFQHPTDLALSEYLRGWFFVTLLLAMTLVLLGAALLFSLPLSTTWSALALGYLSILAGLGILLLSGYHR